MLNVILCDIIKNNNIIKLINITIKYIDNNKIYILKMK